MEDYNQEYEQRFAWRKERQIHNLQELAEIAQSGGADALKIFPELGDSIGSSRPHDALRWSIVMLWCEAAECYIFGEFQSCVLVCGAIVERCLKLEYSKANGSLPKDSHWTLGACINKCKGVVKPEVIHLAQQILGPRNSRAHALLEHSDPQLSILGGPNQGVEVISSRHAQIEPYRGEARSAIENTFQILTHLYGKE